MIKFFRKIRQKLLSQNKFSKYLLYAFGEIVLVVIGILIALQINNWNNKRLDNLQAKDVKLNIHNEFIKNQKILNSSIKLNQDALDACARLIDLTGTDKSDLLKYNLDSLLNSSLSAEFYFPTRSSLDNVIQSGTLKLLDSEELKNSIQDWLALLEQMKSYKEVQTEWQNNQYLPFLLDKISFRQMDIYNKKSWAGKSKIDIDYYPTFQDIRLENLLDNNLFLIEYTIDRLNELNKLQNKIITLTND
ncbi:hypothetical protein MTsPCn9_11380 [Croceitalea sp. MTPC9]|uniref:DUF6090 family protein n=1 Tax=unclassified Croceitalea TaxID=2632280 RepID=UPI002B3999B0|nr:hypothetical protein MTsPCn6_25860 [Croceitalea sp. MTPC6]GMN16202.1 hypothetical protein MTsPCn9_11380 [Croceitalea sp. MTPC9]